MMKRVISLIAITGFFITTFAFAHAAEPELAKPSALAVAPTDPSIPKGVTLQFVATATFSDGTTRDITTQATWKSSDTKVATIDKDKGLATALNAGTTIITATLVSIASTTALTVTSELPASISIAPSNPSIPLGVTQRFTATATYSDKTTHDITTQVTWKSSDEKVATVNDKSGLATAVSAGKATITATFKSISGSATLTVTSATLTSISLTPANADLELGVQEAIQLKTNGLSEADIMEILHKNEKYQFGYAQLTPDQEARLGKSFSQDFIKNWVGVPQYVTIGASAIYLARDNKMVGAGVLRIFFYPRNYFAPLNNLPCSPKPKEDVKSKEDVKFWERIKYNINPDNPQAWIHRIALNVGLTTAAGTDTSNADNFLLVGISYEINRAALFNIGWAVSTVTGPAGSRGQIYYGITLDSNLLKVLGVMK